MQSYDIAILLQPYYNMTISVSLEQLCIKITFKKYKTFFRVDIQSFNLVNSLFQTYIWSLFSVPCPPGSHSDSERRKCELCEVMTYQDLSGQSSCKTCESQSTEKMTSTARGAEGCFVDYSMFTINESIISFHNSDVYHYFRK